MPFPGLPCPAPSPVSCLAFHSPAMPPRPSLFFVPVSNRPLPVLKRRPLSERDRVCVEGVSDDISPSDLPSAVSPLLPYPNPLLSAVSRRGRGWGWGWGWGVGRQRRHCGTVRLAEECRGQGALLRQVHADPVSKTLARPGGWGQVLPSAPPPLRPPTGVDEPTHPSSSPIHRPLSPLFCAAQSLHASLLHIVTPVKYHLPF